MCDDEDSAMRFRNVQGDIKGTDCCKADLVEAGILQREGNVIQSKDGVVGDLAEALVEAVIPAEEPRDLSVGASLLL